MSNNILLLFISNQCLSNLNNEEPVVVVVTDDNDYGDNDNDDDDDDGDVNYGFCLLICLFVYAVFS